MAGAERVAVWGKAVAKVAGRRTRTSAPDVAHALADGPGREAEVLGVWVAAFASELFHSREQVRVGTGGAVPEGLAVLLQQHVKVIAELRWHAGGKVPVGGLPGGTWRHPAEAQGELQHMSIDGEIRQVEGVDEDAGCCLGSNPGKPQKLTSGVLRGEVPQVVQRAVAALDRKSVCRERVSTSV